MAKVVLNHQPCPSCTSSDAYSEWDDGHGFCFSCNTYFKSKEVHIADFTYEYRPWRGIDVDTFRTYAAKTKIDGEGKPISIGFRYPNGSFKVRLLEGKEFYTQGDISRAGLFGRDKFAAGSHRSITLTEGELDACSLHQVLHSPVCSVQSATSATRDCTVDRAYLNSFDRIYLAFDNDVSGREAARSVARLFDYNKVFLVKFSNRKDANEYLQAGEGDILKQIWWNSKKYLPDTIISSFDDFRDILQNSPTKGIPYPFPILTEMTYGIRTGESVLITALEGVGKTEIMHAIEYQLLKETDDAVGAIYLEEPKQRHLQAIAGLELRRPVHLPDDGTPTSEIISAVEKAVRTDERLHVYSHFGSDDPELLLDTIRFLVSARRCRYILLDHISMAVSGLAGEEDERRAIDYLVTRLEMMIKELDFALIMVSHVNDLGQTRGSRMIGKVADIRIDVVRDLLNPDSVSRNTAYLTVSKNRFGGKTGAAGSIYFDPVTHTYSEVDHDTEGKTLEEKNVAEAA